MKKQYFRNLILFEFRCFAGAGLPRFARKDSRNVGNCKQTQTVTTLEIFIDMNDCNGISKELELLGCYKETLSPPQNLYF
jgi:hypothetical protein